ncbi:Uu.00g093300.m01.CDS01 [Anthostomella pinea]|uniref:Uu.00g093300.m01.CDS01 n=1 Tax=Anthostomella pinea TaxID=933095 RepID=A0AAI8YI57_9PEZI|nr:Uu.00g093300.m01.CDS01 [Anthostomella pinea]
MDDPERIPLRGSTALSKPVYETSYWMGTLCLLLSFLLVAGELAFQLYFLPAITKSIPAEFAVTIAYIFPAILDNLNDAAWTCIEVDVQAYFDRKLLGTELGRLQRDALRKSDRFADVFQIIMTKLVVFVASVSHACSQTMSPMGGIFAAGVLITLNLGLKRYLNHVKAIEGNWDETLKRNRAL